MPVNDVDPRLLLEDAQADTIRLMTLRVLEDIPMTAVQLQVQQKDLFGDYDRAQAEADFRLGIAVPLGLVILAIGVTFIDVEWWVAVIGGLIGALVTSVLVFRGLQKQSEANDIILRSIIIGAVEAPVFTLIQEALDLKANPSMVDEIRRHKTVRPRSTWQRLRRRFKAE
ncbi:hypothetical protein ASF06_13565 [Agreia sp. Leaf244]|nr:hypothetical protein ASF06_13565 [Agreia sp. Leaf244]